MEQEFALKAKLPRPTASFKLVLRPGARKWIVAQSDESLKRHRPACRGKRDRQVVLPEHRATLPNDHLEGLNYAAPKRAEPKSSFANAGKWGCGKKKMHHVWELIHPIGVCQTLSQSATRDEAVPRLQLTFNLPRLARFSGFGKQGLQCTDKAGTLLLVSLSAYHLTGV